MKESKKIYEKERNTDTTVLKRGETPDNKQDDIEHNLQWC